LRGSWCHEVPEEPMHLAEQLQPLWQAHLEAQAAADEGAEVVAFLRSVERQNWVAFEITTCGMACGPVWNTAWTVLDLSELQEVGLHVFAARALHADRPAIPLLGDEDAWTDPWHGVRSGPEWCGGCAPVSLGLTTHLRDREIVQQLHGAAISMHPAHSFPPSQEE
jgi:hypothetical protein